MQLLAKHEIRYIRSNTYNATDPKKIGDWKITYHSVADLISVKEVLAFGSTDCLFDKPNAEGWTFNL